MSEEEKKEMIELITPQKTDKDYEEEIERLKERIEDLNIINEEHQILNGMIRKELQQKENIIKEVKEYLDFIKEKQKVVGVYTKDIHKHILEILDKENNNE